MVADLGSNENSYNSFLQRKSIYSTQFALCVVVCIFTRQSYLSVHSLV